MAMPANVPALSPSTPSQLPLPSSFSIVSQIPFNGVLNRIPKLPKIQIEAFHSLMALGRKGETQRLFNLSMSPLKSFLQLNWQLE